MSGPDLMSTRIIPGSYRIICTGYVGQTMRCSHGYSDIVQLICKLPARKYETFCDRMESMTVVCVLLAKAQRPAIYDPKRTLNIKRSN